MKGFNKKLAECEHLFDLGKANDFQQGYMAAGIAIQAYPFDDEKSRKTTRDFFALSADESTPFNRGIMSAARDAKADRNEVNNVAPNGVKGNKENFMAKQQVQETRTIEERIAWHNGRINSPFCNEKEKNRSAKRLVALTAQRDAQMASGANGRSALPATPQQNNAYNAGVGYGAAKAGVRVPVQPENKPAFRNGVDAGRALAKKNDRTSF